MVKVTKFTYIKLYTVHLIITNLTHIFILLLFPAFFSDIPAILHVIITACTVVTEQGIFRSKYELFSFYIMSSIMIDEQQEGINVSKGINEISVASFLLLKGLIRSGHCELLNSDTSAHHITPPCGYISSLLLMSCICNHYFLVTVPELLGNYTSLCRHYISTFLAIHRQ